ncbi:MAG: integrase core domain-containing protein [Actinobacteria bacterium]|nr:integrase core domain-containing protein [Actinomycetota bacterium]
MAQIERDRILLTRTSRDFAALLRQGPPRSPTTTGKVERFHKTLTREFLDGKTFDSIVEAQAAIDVWVARYNTERPHQGIGMVTPLERFELAVADPLEPVEPAALAPVEVVAGPDVEVVTCKVSTSGTISLDTFKYLAGRWLAGQTVQVTSREGVLEIFNRGVHVASHARRFRPGPAPAPRLQQRQPRRPATVGVPVVRKVDGSGSVSFAGHAYRVGNRYKRMSAVVTIVGEHGPDRRGWPARTDPPDPSRPIPRARRVRQPRWQTRRHQRRPTPLH